MANKISPRRRARECAVQALYSWSVSKNAIEEVEVNFLTDEDMKGVDKPYFRKLLRNTVEHINDVEQLIEPFLDRKLGELDPIEKVILAMAVYELQYQPDVPYKVVINEAIEVAKVFGAEESHKYINGVLDKLAPTIRARD